MFLPASISPGEDSKAPGVLHVLAVHTMETLSHSC